MRPSPAAALFLSNNDKALHAGLDRHLGRDKKSIADVAGVAEAAKLLPAEPLVSFWLNMETVRKSPAAKAAYQSPPRDDPNLTVLLGHYLDLLGRTPFVCAGVYAEKNGFLATIRMPARPRRHGRRPDHARSAGRCARLAPLARTEERPV